MVERSYREEITQLRWQLQEKELTIRELNGVLQTGNSQNNLHEVALKLACN